ncbi:Uncharacterised protein [Mycobacteroides abscessus subsp. abscessus]|nr:Uncharacterised protein [Mycobacteroides abscessus subsp. abscessus]
MSPLVSNRLSSGDSVPESRRSRSPSRPTVTRSSSQSTNSTRYCGYVRFSSVRIGR